MRVIVGGLVQESNTFSTASVTVDDFRRYYMAADEELASGGTARNELSGFYLAAKERGVELLPTLYAGAVSSGRIGRTPFDELKRMLLSRIGRLRQADGVLLALHGAWCADDEDDAVGEVLEDVRAIVGPGIKIVVTLDSHANVTRRIAALADGIAGYRTFPHVDYMETGHRAACLLFDMIEDSRRPAVAFRKVPMIVPAENQQTYRGPMRELWLEAEAGEKAGASIATSLFAVQPWLDVKEMGCSVVVVGADRARAEAEADRLAAMMWERRAAFDVELHTVEAIVGLLDGEDSGRPVVLSDSADSPGAGSPGDSNYVLRELLRLNVQHRRTALLSIVDAEAARKASAAGSGSRVKLAVGHSISTEAGLPLEIEAEVAAVGSGKFRFGGGFIKNLEADMGHCAVLAIGGLSLLVMENAVFTGDPAMYRSIGLEPAEADIVLVKSANQFRSEYEKLSSRIYILDTPGASTANIKSLNFVNIDRPMYPFDDHFDWRQSR
ncbi:M81 family metallopeptidase [Cohnella hashimotonis]|uniref:M81 family metallopeptidase n=1 Tax=Cohnella hashimotonis TaxID=2826895 RepID=A0ABT6TL79_9BACL|nr:M81 family metallopeptidase [Cohnella hashimotonis]MDI4647326.1 M81 family metallopeptidase [Cohnella hashimotonis]